MFFKKAKAVVERINHSWNVPSLQPQAWRWQLQRTRGEPRANPGATGVGSAEGAVRWDRL